MEFEYPRNFKSENYARRDSSSHFRRSPTSVLLVKIQVSNLIGIGGTIATTFRYRSAIYKSSGKWQRVPNKSFSTNSATDGGEGIERKFCVTSTPEGKILHFSLVIFHGSNFHFFLQVVTKSREHTYFTHRVNHLSNNCAFRKQYDLCLWFSVRAQDTKMEWCERCEEYCWLIEGKLTQRVYERVSALSTRSIPIINRPLGAPTKCIFDTP